MLNVMFNNIFVEIDDCCSLESFINKYIDGCTLFAVAINKTFAPKECYAEIILQDGDCIDIVEPMVGG